jgi:hypothetical protein
MRRTLLAGGAILSALCLSLCAYKAHSDTQLRANAAFKKLVARMPRMKTSAVGTPAPRNHTITFVLDTGDTVFLDRDEDGTLTFGDELVVRGPLLNYSSGRDVGTWEGTLTITNDVTFYTNLTLRFAGSGALTITGAPVEDGARGDYFLAPIVGVTGRVSARGSAGFFNDTSGNLVVALGVR